MNPTRPDPPPRLLVVEDDPASRDIFVRRLSSRGFAVSAVCDGESCLVRVAEEPPDLILLDVNLPGMGGLDVVRRLRSAWTRDALPVILVTALGESADVVSGLEAGANDYVVKPVNLAVLLARVGVCLQIKRSVAALMAAERDRSMVQALGGACEQIAQPMTAVTVLLEMLVRQPPTDPAELRAELSQVLAVTREANDLIHRLRAVARSAGVPYARRVAWLEGRDRGPVPGAAVPTAEPPPLGASGARPA
jgi:CheY-like chemotaxis protein